LIQGLLNKGIAEKQNMIAADVHDERTRAIREKFGISTTLNNGEAVSGAEVVVLSVKPQILPGVMPPLKGKVASGALVLSIVAGARIDSIVNGLAHASVVRSMPNTPAQIGEGIT